MSWRDDRYSDNWERREEARREYRADVFYEAWRSGIDPDRAADCANDCYYDGRTPEQCVAGTAREIRDERDARRAREEAEYAEMERYYEDQRETEHWNEVQRQQEAEQAAELEPDDGPEIPF